MKQVYEVLIKYVDFAGGPNSHEHKARYLIWAKDRESAEKRAVAHLKKRVRYLDSFKFVDSVFDEWTEYDLRGQ